MRSIKRLNDYRKIVGDAIIDSIYHRSKKFSKKHIVCISATSQGGGVAEMLNSIVFLFNEAGLDFGWRILHGTPDFFNITKGFHNALQGGKLKLTKRKKEIYLETNRMFSVFTHLDHHDLVMIHDPQPLPLIIFYKKKQPWIFRCHIDISSPNKQVWDYLKSFINKYDHFVVSSGVYEKKLRIPQSIIQPAIDPLSAKNKKMSVARAERYLKRVGVVDVKKPIISQISRYDKWKDFEGAVEVFKRVKQKVDCQLVLLGNTVRDDPEAVEIYHKLVKKYGREDGVTILVNVPDNDLVVNALQTKSEVVIQKSIKEGFGLTVSEALYKGTPVVASRVGGIPLQVVDGVNGFLHDPKDYKGFAESIIKILTDERLKKEMGTRAHQYVRDNFLITRLMEDWLTLFEEYL